MSASLGAIRTQICLFNGNQYNFEFTAELTVYFIFSSELNARIKCFVNENSCAKYVQNIDLLNVRESWAESLMSFSALSQVFLSACRMAHRIDRIEWLPFSPCLTSGSHKRTVTAYLNLFSLLALYIAMLCLCCVYAVLFGSLNGSSTGSSSYSPNTSPYSTYTEWLGRATVFLEQKILTVRRCKTKMTPDSALPVLTIWQFIRIFSNELFWQTLRLLEHTLRHDFCLSSDKHYNYLIFATFSCFPSEVEFVRNSQRSYSFLKIWIYWINVIHVSVGNIFHRIHCNIVMVDPLVWCPSFSSFWSSINS